MALWRLELTGLEATGRDDNGWPLTRIVNTNMQVEEGNIIRLHRTAKALARERFPDLRGVHVRGCERVDKKTDKNYGFHDEPDELRCELTPQQQAALRKLKEEIYARLVSGSRLKSGIDLLLGWESRVRPFADDLALFQDGHGVVRHGEAREIITSLENFYSRVTPEELEVLYMDEVALSHGDLEIVRSFNVAVVRDGR